MHFAHDTETALIAAAALVNTAVEGEGLGSLADLVHFLDAHEFTGRRDGDLAELRAVREVRDELSDLWRSADDSNALVSKVNSMLQATRALPQLVRHDGWDWHLHVTDPRAPLHERLGAEAAMALVDVVRGKDLARLKVCAAHDCDAVLVDLSRNSSKRFCDTGNCANRTHVAAYRERRRSASG